MNKVLLAETASQTGGPYVHIGLAPALVGLPAFARGIGVAGAVGAVGAVGAALADPGTPGERIAFEGQVFDGAGSPMRDVLIECWQADATGRYGAGLPGFRGFGRSTTDFDTGLYRFETLKPGRVAMPDGRLQAPHIALLLLARGINVGLHTRLYFDDEAQANAQDPLLAGIEPPARRQTLIARAERSAEGEGGVTTYRFDIRVQHPDPAQETVFLDL
jgi:protocatechuate 3,4-dioxygenase, alpha subunit